MISWKIIRVKDGGYSNACYKAGCMIQDTADEQAVAAWQNERHEGKKERATMPEQENGNGIFSRCCGRRGSRDDGGGHCGKMRGCSDAAGEK